MFRLMDRYYSGVNRGRFERDLQEKDWVILMHGSNGEVLGFSTQMVYPLVYKGREIRTVFSGDTIVDSHYWGDNPLALLWGRLVVDLMEEQGGEWYWFLIVQGYKTYRFLPIFFYDYYPRYNAETPYWARDLMTALGGSKFGPKYDAAHGIVRHAQSSYCLRQGVADISEQRMHNPHIRFFEEVNPGHIHGDELCCLAPLTLENFRPSAIKKIGRTQPVPHPLLH
jgi:hypothetical protein